MIRNPLRKDLLRYSTIFMLAACASDQVGPNTHPWAVATWGDSLTDGGAAPDNFPNTLSSLLARPVYNGGVSGETSTQILARALQDTARSREIAIYWMGRNNFGDPAQVESDIEQAVSSLPHTRFLVLSVLNGDYPDEVRGTAKFAEIMILNARLATRFPANFVDVRSALIGQGDVPPPELRVDELHLNPSGNLIVAEQVASAIVRHGW